jgi:hypothetical protein
LRSEFFLSQAVVFRRAGSPLHAQLFSRLLTHAFWKQSHRIGVYQQHQFRTDSNQADARTSAEDAMKPIELVVFDNNIRDIFLFRLAASLEPYPINVRAALDGRRAHQMFASERPPPDLLILEAKSEVRFVRVRTCGPVHTRGGFHIAIRLGRRAALNLGVAACIMKPYHRSEFVEAVSRMVRHWTRGAHGLTRGPLSPQVLIPS